MKYKLENITQIELFLLLFSLFLAVQVEILCISKVVRNGNNGYKLDLDFMDMGSPEILPRRGEGFCYSQNKWILWKC